MEINAVSYNGGKVVLNGHRLATAYEPSEGDLKAGQQLKSSFLRLPNELRVEVDMPAIDAVTIQKVRDSVFIRDQTDLIASVPDEWKPVLRNEVRVAQVNNKPQLRLENADWPAPQDGKEE